MLQIDRIAESGQFSLVGGRVFSSLSELIKYYHDKQHHPLPCAVLSITSFVCMQIKTFSKTVFNNNNTVYRALDSMIAASIEPVHAVKQTAFNGVNPDQDTLISIARAVYCGLVQQSAATGLDVLPMSYPSGGAIIVIHIFYHSRV